MTNLEAALYYYNKHNLCVIPWKNIKKEGDEKPSKTPIIKWTPYQTKRCTEQEITDWWTRCPDAMVGIVTGAVSGMVVFDTDDEESDQYFQSLLPESFLCPMVSTPSGWKHYYFKAPAGKILNNAAKINGYKLDFRGDGGFVGCPPSTNGKGKVYAYLPGLSLDDIALPDMPIALSVLLKECISYSSYVLKTSSSVPSNLLISGKNEEKTITLPVDNSVDNFDCPKNVRSLSKECRESPKVSKEMPTVLQDGRRDNDLFHVANSLAKSRTPFNEITQILEILAKSCNPPFPEKEINIKIQSAINRVERKDRNLSAEVREWVLSSNGIFLSNDVQRNLDLSNRQDKKLLSEILRNLCKEKIIEKAGNKNGCWRKIDRSYTEQCWWEGDGTPLPLRIPLEVGKLARIYAGNVLLLEGQKSQGKSAFALEFVRLNSHLFGSKALYQNVEMADSELTERFNAYGDIMTPEQWRNCITIIRQTSEWWDKILPDGLNVVDYLVEYKEAYLIADFVWKIHQKLKQGIALILVQRDPLRPYPVGGRAVRDIPRLVMSLIRHRIKLEDVKSFYPSEYGNPTGLTRKYKQVAWWKFKEEGAWHHEEEKI